MKKCPECAEEIQDEAKRCRYCGTDLRPQIPIIPGYKFTAAGETYVFGAQLTFGGEPHEFQIWRRESVLQQRGDPVERFRANRKGLDAAWARFQELEPINEAMFKPKCPSCGSENAIRVSGPEKVASAMLVGLFALSKMGKQWRCENCGVIW